MNKLQTQLVGFFNRGLAGRLTNKLIVPRDEWDFKIHVSLCIFRTIQTAVLDSLFKLMVCQKPKVTVSNAIGDSLIDRARCREASDFLNYSDADVLLMVDDDIEFSPGGALKICMAANDKKGIVAGTCVIKREEGCWIASKPLDDAPPIVFSNDSDLVEIKWAGAGMIAFHRNVLTDMIQQLKLPLCHPTDLRFWPFFQTMIWQHPNGDHLFLSEDWAFCERARQCGYKIWLDPSVRTTHWGVYGYNLDDMLRPSRRHHERITYEDCKDKIITPKDEGVKIKPSFT